MDIQYAYDHRVNDPEPMLADPSVMSNVSASMVPMALVGEDTQYSAEFECDKIDGFNESSAPAVPSAPQPVTKTASGHLFRDMVDFRHDYPDTTHVHCWHCVHPFMTRPIGIPVKRDDANGTFMGFGCFCSTSCALTYAEARKMNTNLLRQMHVEYDPVGSLKPAPPQSMLTIFGGSFDIDVFRKKSMLHGTKWRTYKWPLMPYTVLREEIVQDNLYLPMRKIQPRSMAPPRQTKLRSVFAKG